MPRSSARALLVLTFAVLTPFARAQTAPATPVVTPDKPFTLEDAIALAVRKNFNLQIQGNTVDQQKEALNIAKAIFDPNLTASARRSVNQAASNISILEGTQREGQRTDSTTVNVGVSERLPTNGTVSIGANLSRNATNSTTSLLNPAFGNGISASINQPLLQNAGRVAARSNIERTRLGLGIAYINYKSQVLDLIAQAENAYYNLVNARETLRIRQSTFETANRFFEENQTRRTTGVATDLDVLSSEVGVANARRAIILAEESVRNAEENLLNLINLPEFDVRPGAVKFEDYHDGIPNFASSYKMARDYYPQSLSADETLKQLMIDLETARRNKLPNLNLDASLGYTARATNAGYEQVIANLPNDHGNNWSVGLTYQMPWGQHADKARYRQAQIAVGSQKIRIEQAEQELIVRVRQAVRSIETNISAVEIAAKATELSLRQYEQQKARFDAGLATAFLVLQQQDALENARFQELTAKINLRRAVTELRRLEGSSIEKYRIQLPQ
ncbi:MAG TPA: TolC family protein [Opitutaceae bacterium]|nr:TolC family protein [Opitutaceae bacterium]